jgi:hypothetical protein
MPYSPHCTYVSGNHVASIIKVDEDGNGKATKCTKPHGVTSQKTLVFLCDFLVM